MFRMSCLELLNKNYYDFCGFWNGREATPTEFFYVLYIDLHTTGVLYRTFGENFYLETSETEDRY